MAYLDKPITDREIIESIMNNIPTMKSLEPLHTLNLRAWEQEDDVKRLNIIRHNFMKLNMPTEACYIRDHLQTHCLN